MVKNPPANVRDIRDVGLIPGRKGKEDPLKEGMATHSSILAWRVPWTEEPGRLQSTGLQRAGHPCASVVVVHGLSCLTACGIFLDQGRDHQGPWESEGSCVLLVGGPLSPCRGSLDPEELRAVTPDDTGVC